MLQASCAACFLITTPGQLATRQERMKPTKPEADQPIVPKPVNNERRQRTLRRFSTRIREAGLQQKIKAAWLFAAADLSAATQVCLGRSRPALNIGETSDFDPNAGLRLDPDSAELDLQIPAGDLGDADCHFGLMLLDAADAGTLPHLSLNGGGESPVSIDARHRDHGAIVVSCASRSTQIGTSVDTDGSGFHPRHTTRRRRVQNLSERGAARLDRCPDRIPADAFGQHRAPSRRRVFEQDRVRDAWHRSERQRGQDLLCHRTVDGGRHSHRGDPGLRSVRRTCRGRG